MCRAHGHCIGLRLVTALLGIAIGAAAASAGPVYPLKASANGRYLVDQDDVPFLLTGESPQAMIVNVTEAEAESFFANRAAHGFNTVWINLLCTTYTGGRPDASTLDGTVPFTATIPATGSYDLTTPNEAYFAHVDRILALAAGHGIQVLLDPIETGGFVPTMLDNGLTRCRAYGRFLGTRYAGVDNIVWMSGNDFQGWRDPANDAVVREVALGIRDQDTRHLHTAELDYLASSSLDDANWSGILGLNATYTYYPTYARLRDDYNRHPFLPNFMVEANYEFESLQGPVTTAPILRKQEYWSMTSGVAGQMYGNGYTWPFNGGWQGQLDTPGAVQIGLLRAFFDPRAWYALVPDTAHTVVTAGYGTYSSTGYVAANDFLTAARTPDGSLVVAYTPIVRTFTIDMSQLSAAATTRWFDPSSGAYVAIAGSPFASSGTRNFTPPGNNADGDGGWVLVLETNPPETEPPVAAITSPASGATVSGVVAIIASASDNVGVIGVQFQVDHVNFGAELLSAPDTIDWNTLAASNGDHVLAAIARDLAGNRDTATIVVTVDNPVLPPPTDHLVLAYAFDEAGGVAIADRSGHGNAATLHGGAFVPGRHGNALALDGAGDYAEAPNSATLDIAGTGLTIAFWVKVVSTGSGVDYVVVGKPWSPSAMPSPFYQYGVEYSNSGNKTLDFFFGAPGGVLHGPYRISPAAGVWTHAAFTFDGGTVKGYLGGAEVLSASDNGSLVARGNSLRLGVDGAYQQFFDGALDDLRIYDRALTGAEIVSAMETPVTDTATGVEPAPGASIDALVLDAGQPNPFRGVTRVSFALPAPGEVELAVYDASGRHVRTLEHGWRAAGAYASTWNGADERGRAMPAGRYFLRLRAGGIERTQSLVRIR